MTNNFLDNQTKETIQSVIFDYKKKREKVLADLGSTEKDFKDKAASIRKKVFSDFENNLIKAKEKLKANGFEVYEAVDATAANQLVRDLLKGVDRIAKSKSNTGREIGLANLLKELRIQQEAFETDLGDFLVELFGDEDMHYVLPAIHLTPKRISDKIKEVFGVEVEAEAEKLTHYLCSKIRENILKAEVGITGANFFTQTGQVVLLENEGNISLVSRLPKRHIVICGIDKLVASVEDAFQLCQAAAVFGTGQSITQYISVISGPSKTADIQNQMVLGAQGTHQVQIVLVDNGRRKMLDQGFGDLLRCINCGACVNFCPVYHNLAAQYGGDYLGSKGIVMSAFTSQGKNNLNLVRSYEKGSYWCTLCGNCSQNCPMQIDLAELVKKIRGLQNFSNLQTEQNLEMLKKIKEHGNPFGQVADEEIPDKLYCC